MWQLYYRFISVFQNQGMLLAIKKATHFTLRYTRHILGKKGLHRLRSYHEFLVWWNSGRGQYSSIANPFKIIHVNPSSINYVTGRGPNPGRFQFEDIGLISGGNWDKTNDSFDEIPVVKSIFKRYCEQVDWDEIQYIHDIKSGKITGNGRYHSNSTSKLRQHCKAIDDLYQNIEQNGYQSKETLIQEEISDEDKFIKNDGLERYNEVAIDIGREGQFLFVNGRHRLAIAKILNLDKIPVRVCARHKKWQEIRETISKTPRNRLPKNTKKYIEHPDLQDIIK